MKEKKFKKVVEWEVEPNEFNIFIGLMIVILVTPIIILNNIFDFNYFYVILFAIGVTIILSGLGRGKKVRLVEIK